MSYKQCFQRSAKLPIDTAPGVTLWDEDSKFTGMYQRRISVQSVFKLQFCLAILREILQYGEIWHFPLCMQGNLLCEI